MVDTVQTSVETDISPSTNSTVQMEISIKKSVADEIARILSGIISITLTELNVMKPIVSNIDTSTSIMISTITGEGNTTAMPKESPAKDITHPTKTDEPDETEEMSMSTQQQKKANALTKAVLIQQRKSVCNAKKGVHFDVDLDGPGETII
eukprot:10789089-Ditylum_brightwellii.AAC.2